MSIARGPVERPVLTFIIFLIIVILGIISFFRLPIDLMPEITYPTISVATSYPNVGPQEIEEQITRIVEEAIAAVQGVKEITSTSTEGSSSVRISFEWGTNLDIAANDVRDRIDRILSRLPDDVDRPSIRKFDLSAFPVLILGVSAEMDPLVLKQTIEDQIKYRLERINGVASIDIRGGWNREISVRLSSEKMQAYGISITEIQNAIARDNENTPVGLVTNGGRDLLVRTMGQFTSLNELKNVVVRNVDQQSVKLSDICEIEDTHEEITQIHRIDNKPGLRISISKQSGANTVDVVKTIKHELKKIAQDYPQIQLVPIIDSSKYIKQSINNVGVSVFVGGLLAIVILFLFLGNISSTGIIATAIPVSVLATFGLLYFSGLTLNIMTFGGLALGIGMLVDSSIVVLENISRHKEKGSSVIKSTLQGTSEVWSAILASVLTTIVVFLPVIFIKGMSGVMFQQMAIVVSFSLLCSLVVSLTLIPMLSSRFMSEKSADANKAGTLPAVKFVSSLLKKAEDYYLKILRFSLLNRKYILIICGLLFAVSLFMITLIGVELMPETDEGEVRVDLEMAIGTELEDIDAMTTRAEKIVSDNVPELVSMITRIGSGGWRARGGHTSQIRISLPERNNRKRSSKEIANDLRKKLSSLVGVKIRTRAAGGLFIMRMGTSSDDNLSVEVRGYNLKIANDLAKKIDEAVQQVTGITDTRISREEGNPELVLHIDREKAADSGLSISDVTDALQTLISGSNVSYYRESGKQFPIFVRLKEEDRTSMKDILNLSLQNRNGDYVILSNIISTETSEGPIRIERKNQERIINITANFIGRDMGSVIKDVRKAIKDIPVHKDFSILFGGDYEEQQKSFRELMFAFALAIVLVFLVMAGQFESFLDPFVILFSVPMALIGVVITMIFTNTVFSMQALIGCIMLAGIVVNNAILLVDYTNRLRRESGLSLQSAIETAGLGRLRPILMTTLTTILGLLPMSFGIGDGGEAQAPMGRVVIGGLISSTLITLVLVPVIYSIFEQRLKKENST